MHGEGWQNSGEGDDGQGGQQIDGGVVDNESRWWLCKEKIPKVT